MIDGGFREWGFRVQFCSMFVLLRSLGFMYIYVDASVEREPTSTLSLARFPKIPTGNPDTKLLKKLPADRVRSSCQRVQDWNIKQRGLMSNINLTINLIDRNILNKQFSPNIKLLEDTSTTNHTILDIYIYTHRLYYRFYIGYRLSITQSYRLY
jgi:hypothetical protein